MDFAAAFPSLSRKFIFVVLRAMRLPHGLLHLIEKLYRDLGAGVLLNGAEACRIKPASGIKQGCPLSGALLALCLDPFICCYMTRITFISSRLCAFADDIGVALVNNKRQLPQALELLRRWGLASGFQVNGEKAQLVTAGTMEV